jgi:flavodoxin
MPLHAGNASTAISKTSATSPKDKSMNKILIVYYSRTGVTKKIAEYLKEKLNADIEEVLSVTDRSGLVGYMLCAREATQKKSAQISELLKDPAKYDLMVVGGPIWAWNLSSPVRAVLENNKEKFKKIAGFFTMGDSGDDKAFASMEKITGKNLIAKLAITTKDINSEAYKEKVEAYCATLLNS